MTNSSFRNKFLTILTCGHRKSHRESSEDIRAEPHTQHSAIERPIDLMNISRKAIYKTRTQYGVNLGSWFLMERWIAPRIFIDAGCTEVESSEFDLIQRLHKKYGRDGAKERLRKHWETFITEADLKWLRQQANVNSVRIPLGYWHLLSEKELQGTPFYPYASCYVDARTILQKKIDMAKSYGIGVLLDLHGLPGGANGNDHSGTRSGRAEFYDNSAFRSKAIRAVQSLSDLAFKNENVFGVQLANETEPGHDAFLKTFYNDCLKFNTADNFNVYIPDCWNLNSWADWVSQQKPDRLVLDTHQYFTFTDEDRKKSPQQIFDHVISKVQQQVRSAREMTGGSVIVGEWSCCLDERTWSKIPSSERKKWETDFGRLQNELFASPRIQSIKNRGDISKPANSRGPVAPSGGGFFWTYKFENGYGGTWSLREMVASGAVRYPSLQEMTVKPPDENKRREKLEYDYKNHCDYWKKKTGTDWDHTRYRIGWEQGWNDAKDFIFKHRDISGYIGLREMWTEHRYQDKDDWEAKHGMLAGIDRFYGLSLKPMQVMEDFPANLQVPSKIASQLVV